jgi:hypothetical protein
VRDSNPRRCNVVWKVRRRVSTETLEAVLNRLSAQRWNIVETHWTGASFTIVANKQKRITT